jgi:hypothetical protein
MTDGPKGSFAWLCKLPQCQVVGRVRLSLLEPPASCDTLSCSIAMRRDKLRRDSYKSVECSDLSQFDLFLCLRGFCYRSPSSHLQNPVLSWGGPSMC